jgi:hypothetical protein
MILQRLEFYDSQGEIDLVKDFLIIIASLTALISFGRTGAVTDCRY